MQQSHHRITRRLFIGGIASAGVALRPDLAAGQDAVIIIQERNFRAGAGRITFDEVPRGTRNPTITPAMYGGGPDSPTVSFAGRFRGREPAGAACPRGAARTGCLAGTPSIPLTLDLSAPPTFTAYDGAPAIRSVALSGTPQWNGTIAVMFDRDLAAVGLTGGSFEAIGGTAITIYDRLGRRLGETRNHVLGQEFLGLATRDLSPRIAGLEFSLVGAELAGFGIDNLRFGAPEQVDVPGVRPPPRQEPPPPPPPQRAPPPPPPPPERPLLLP
jgi:hypothetical protein